MDNPRLLITNEQGGFVVSWPVSATNWVLEESTVLPPASWTRRSDFEISGASRVLRLAPEGESRFYRLLRLNAPVPGLVGQWALDEGTGESAGDGSGAGVSLSLSNVSWGAGRFGAGALQFNGAAPGTAASRAWGGSSLAAGGEPFSVSLWFNPDSVGNGSRGIVGNDVDGLSGWQVALHTTGPGTNLLVFAAAGGSLNVTGRTVLLPGQWHHLAVTHDGTMGSLYLDSELLARGAGSIDSGAGPILLGGGIGGHASFLGRLDEVRVFTNCLSPEEISLSGHWRFEEGLGDFIADTSVRGNHGLLTDPAARTEGHEGMGIDLSRGQVVIGNADYNVLPESGGAFSISFWLKPQASQEGRSGLMSCGAVSNGWELALEREGGETRLYFGSTNSGGTLGLRAPVPLATETWTKVDVTYNGGIATLYADGRKLAAGNGAIRGSTAPLVVGSAPGATNFNGVLDELKVYCRERGEAEIGPVALVMWETVLRNTATNITAAGSGPSGKSLSYAIVPVITPTNGTVSIDPAAGVFTYSAGARKGPDAFTYTVSDGEFTSPPAIVTMSVVQPHWLSPEGGTVEPLDGSNPAQAWPAGTADALDAIWKTNNFYDCFFYAPGEFQTRGWKYMERSTANPGCKHVGSGATGPSRTTVKLVDIWQAWGEEVIFGPPYTGFLSDGFEIHHMELNCNGDNLPKYTQGEPVWIRIPLATTGIVESLTLRWANKSVFAGRALGIGLAAEFSVCTRRYGTNTFVTNCTPLTATGLVSVITLGAEADEVFLQLDRRAANIFFYAISEIELAGAATALAKATIPGGGESRLNSSYPAAYAADGSTGTSWASGAEAEAQLELRLPPGTSISQVNLQWNCKTVSGLGRLGPASGYLIRAWDEAASQFLDVPFVRHGRMGLDWEAATFGTVLSTNAITTTRVQILLTNREPGVNFYSIREITFRNGASVVSVPKPAALNSLAWGDYSVLRAFDGDSNTEWASGTQGMVGALNVTGQNLKFTNLKVIGFGTKGPRECFVFRVVFAQPFAGRTLGNVLVEDCLFTQPATNNTDGATIVSVVAGAGARLTNALVRRCTVSDIRPYFTYSHAFSALDLANCVATNCSEAVYFEPEPVGGGDRHGNVLVRSNQFLNVTSGIYVLGHASYAQESLTCLNNEIVLSGRAGFGFGICDTCNGGSPGTTTNVTVLNNIIRYADWSARPGFPDMGLYYADIQHAVFGNNIVALGTANSLRVRQCPGGVVYPPPVAEDCDHPLIGPPPSPSPIPCLNAVPAGYRRAWFENRDLNGNLIPVRWMNNGVDGLCSQQQWPD